MVDLILRGVPAGVFPTSMAEAETVPCEDPRGTTELVMASAVADAVYL